MSRSQGFPDPSEQIRTLVELLKAPVRRERIEQITETYLSFLEAASRLDEADLGREAEPAFLFRAGGEDS